jgi:hypothetical protein
MSPHALLHPHQPAAGAPAAAAEGPQASRHGPPRSRTGALVALGAIAGVLCLVALAGGASATSVPVRPGGLRAALAAARPGDVLQLRTGSYNESIAVPAFSADVTLTPFPGEKPVLTSLTLTGGSHLALRDLAIRSLVATRVADLSVTGGELTTGGAFFTATDRLKVTGVRIHDAFDGLVVRGAKDFAIRRNECFNVPVATRAAGGDCLQMVTTSRFQITDNVFRDQPDKPHTDAIEILDNNADGVIARNRFQNVRGLVLTPGSQPLRDQWRITVESNLFARTRTFAFNGVRMHDSVFAYNTAVDGGFVQFGGASSGNVVVGNIMSRFQVDVTRQRTYVPVEDYNLIASVPAGYRRGAHDLSGTARFRNPAAFDYRLAPGSPGIAAGCLAHLPALDCAGVPRTRADLGAYAFQP